MKTSLVVLLAAVFLFTLPAVKGNVTITNSTGTFSVGIGPNGELFDDSTGVGIRRISDGYDPLAPGTPRDSWGVYSVSGAGSAYADCEDFQRLI